MFTIARTIRALFRARSLSTGNGGFVRLVKGLSFSPGLAESRSVISHSKTHAYRPEIDLGVVPTSGFLIACPGQSTFPSFVAKRCRDWPRGGSFPSLDDARDRTSSQPNKFALSPMECAIHASRNLKSTGASLTGQLGRRRDDHVFPSTQQARPAYAEQPMPGLHPLFALPTESNLTAGAMSSPTIQRVNYEENDVDQCIASRREPDRDN